MTDRLKGVVVTFDRDIRVDDAEGIVNAIKHIKGVVSVKPVVADIEDHMARERIRREMSKDIYELLEKWSKTS